jgi:RNA polymerase sigma-70 factor (ECF subfamily)
LLTSFAKKKQPPQPWDESACIAGCIRNELMYQEQLYKKFYGVMMAIIMRYTQDKDAAVSILNNGFLKVFKHIESFKYQGSLEGWIRKIIIHAISDYFRYKHPPTEISHEVLPDKTDFSVNPSLNYDYQLLLNVLQELPPTTRIVVNLFIVEGYTHKNIAEIMGISENTSNWHVSEGRKMLQKKLSSIHL